MFLSHLPALQVVLPLIAAPICLVLHHARLAWAWAMLISWSAFGIALSLLNRVLSEGVISYHIGKWAPPWGIEYRLDEASVFMLVLVTTIGVVVTTFAKESVEKEIVKEKIHLFYTCYLLCFAGLLGMSITGDVFNIFVFLEISSLSAYALISMSDDRRALTASFRYLVMGTVGATFYIIGVGLIYMATGSLNIADLAVKLPAVADTQTVRAALAFLIVGLSLKLALFPLHSWLPNAYAYAPSAVSAFIAATATKVAVYVMLRVIFTIFGVSYVFGTMNLGPAILSLAIMGMFAASAMAISQKNVKRLLAYSSIAQIGYIMLGISFATVTGLSGGIVHLFNHALIKCCLFMVMGCVFFRINSTDIKDMAGLGKRMPFTMAAFVIGGLSLIGVPSTVGFISKWYLMQAAFEAGSWVIAIMIPLSSLLAVVYIWRVVEVAYFSPSPDGETAIKEAPVSMQIPIWVMVAGIFYFGINAEFTLDVARRAAESLLGGIVL